MARKGVLIGLLVAVLAGTAWAFEPYFSDAAGKKIGTVWEGQQVYIAIKDPDKGACGIDQFAVDLVVFDFKTGAYLGSQTPGTAITTLTNVVFRELGGIGSGLYFWVAGPGSNTKVSLQVGRRNSYTTIEGQTHILGLVSPSTITNFAGAAIANVGWWEGAWEYVDQNVLDGDPYTAPLAHGVGIAALPRERLAARVDFEGLAPGLNATPGNAAIVG
ncbi:MAG: hypothetical protein N2320_05445, partial [Candidatus Bipolaricaulota bacterium]|nr:hypothetical protein [Candidatus Bipolaricaulota bacterium]